jgi:dTDP-4-dehydrorhamnose 3,5-epimerase-like enzyme
MTDTNSLSKKIKLIERKKIKDNRGWFLKTINGLEEGLPSYTGEVYVVYSNFGGSRGGHFHKKATEWFTIIEGESLLKLHDIDTNEYYEIYLKNSNPTTIVIPPFVAHRFDSIKDKPFMILAYTNELYSPDDTIEIEF